MKRFAAILAVLLAVGNACAWFVPVGANNWTNDVEANANSIQNNSREFAHGESWYISPRLVDSGVPRNIDTNTTWVMYYQTPQMTTNWYTNASVYFPVYDSTGTTIQTGRVSALWDASKDFGHRRYLYWLGGTVGGQITYRIMGEISLRDSPGFNAAAVTAPVGSWPYVSTATLGASGAVWRAEWQAADASTLAQAGTNAAAAVAAGLATGTAYRATYADTAGTVTGAQSNMIESALQAEADTLESVVARGGEVGVDGKPVSIDMSNARTNIYGGYLSMLGRRLYQRTCVASGGLYDIDDAAIAFGYLSVASGSWAPIAIGDEAQATGSYGATAIGMQVTASGNYGATARGCNGIASGDWGATAMGYFNTCSGDYGAIALGANAHSSNITAFVWNGIGGEEVYGSHGRGTYNINPLGSWFGVYIGENNLYTLVDSHTDADISAHNTNATAHAGMFAAAESVVTGAVGTVTSGNQYWWVSATNVTLSASLTGGQLVSFAQLRNTATNSITATAESADWKWTGGSMTNTITAGGSMTFGWACSPITGVTNAYATGVGQ